MVCDVIFPLKVFFPYFFSQFGSLLYLSIGIFHRYFDGTLRESILAWLSAAILTQKLEEPLLIYCLIFHLALMIFPECSRYLFTSGAKLVLTKSVKLALELDCIRRKLSIGS